MSSRLPSPRIDDLHEQVLRTLSPAGQACDVLASVASIDNVYS